MPNHVTNQIWAPQAVLDALLRTPTGAEQVRHDQEEQERAVRIPDYKPTPLDMTERFVDFGLLVPPPSTIESGPCSGQHGPSMVCWYEWNVQHWGTKWNGYATVITNEYLRFQTAWTHPWPVIQALSLRFPEATITVSYADEDLGSNIGHYQLKAGEVVGMVPMKEYSNQARDFAAQLCYGKSWAELEAEWALEEEP